MMASSCICVNAFNQVNMHILAVVEVVSAAAAVASAAAAAAVAVVVYIVRGEERFDEWPLLYMDVIKPDFIRVLSSVH